MTTDLKPTNHVLFNNYDYPKPDMVRRVIRGLFGSGALQVRFLFQDLFAKCCLIPQVAQDFGQLLWTTTGVLNI